MKNRPTVLVVDDEPVVTEVVERYLRLEGYDVLLAADGLEAVHMASERQPDLVVLDLMLPGLDGFEVLKRLRDERPVPIIMLTARGEESDRIVGLELGADDYLGKPFSPRELVARVTAVLRRASSKISLPGLEVVEHKGLTINASTRTVVSNERDVKLTPKEFDLLYFLASNPGQVFTREQLLETVWEYAYTGDAGTVTVHIKRLREKVEPDPLTPTYIKTVWSVGYKFEA